MKTPSETIYKSLRKMRRKVRLLQEQAESVNLDEITGTELRRLDLAKATLRTLMQSLPPPR